MMSQCAPSTALKILCKNSGDVRVASIAEKRQVLPFSFTNSTVSTAPATISSWLSFMV